MKALYVVVTLSFVCFLVLSFERPAMAYVDPGSGLFVFQSLSSLVAAALFFARRRIRAFFRSSKHEEDPLLRSQAAQMDARDVEEKARRAA